MPKKRAPIEQLKQAGKDAEKMLMQRGMAMYENLVEKTLKEKPDLILPGIPSYLPHAHTIEASRNMMCDILEMWHAKKHKDPKIKTNIAEFITYTIEQLNRLILITEKKNKIMPKLMQHIENIPVLGKIFAPINQLDVLKSMRKFFVDSFAVSIIVNGEVHTTQDYIKWYLEWTDVMLDIWKKHDGNNTKKEKVLNE